MFYFLPAVVLGYVALGRFGRRAVIGWLALMSVVFYGVWKPKYVFVLLGSILVNYAISRLIAAAKQPRWATAWMVIGIALNLGVLAYFKYLFRFLVYMNQLQVTSREWHQILLPLGISFFTFTQIAYLVDLRQGEADKQDIFSYALFVTFFPHLIAGPIIHHKEMMPQFNAERSFRLDWGDFALGLSWFILGLAKKVLIADRIGQYADATFAAPRGLGMWSAWIGVINYSMQLYFDFSGYSDMAMGLARMFSIRFPFNFNSPYKSANIIDFWARWHMTLTRYITLYLYNPVALAVSRRRLKRGLPVSKKASRTAAGFLTMIALPTVFTLFLAGIWHGAGLQFAIFGMLHAVYLSTNHAWRLWRNKPLNLPRRWWNVAACVLLTYVCVVVAQVFFRANSTRDAVALIGGMFGRNGLGLPVPIAAHLHLAHAAWAGTLGGTTAAAGIAFSLKALAALALFPVVWALPNTQEILGQQELRGGFSAWVATRLKWRPNWAWGVALGATLLAVLAYISYSTSFLYFQF